MDMRQTPLGKTVNCPTSVIDCKPHKNKLAFKKRPMQDRTQEPSLPWGEGYGRNKKTKNFQQK